MEASTKLPKTFEPKATPVKDAWQQQYNRITAAEAELVNHCQQPDTAATTTTTTRTAKERLREARAPCQKQLRVIKIRTLGGLLLHLERSAGVDNVVRGVETCRSADELVELGGVYLRYFIMPFKSSGPTPQPSQHPSRPEFELELEREALYGEELTSGHEISYATAKRAALVRDDYRCLVTGRLDFNYRAVREGGRGPYVMTQCCHIIPKALINNIKVVPDDELDCEISKLAGLGQFQEENKAHQTSEVYTVLKMFGYDHVLPELTGTNIHRLQNILTLEATIHLYFDSLNLWFEPTGTGTPHEYKICVSDEYCRPFCFPSPLTVAPVHVVTLKEADGLPPPSSDYLALHAACCRIAHLSGAVEYIDRLYRDFEELKDEARYISSAEHCEAFIEALHTGIAAR